MLLYAWLIFRFEIFISENIFYSGGFKVLEKGMDPIRDKLKKLKSDVLRSIISENDDMKNIFAETGVKDIADVASEDLDTRMIDAIGSKDKIRLQSIEAALVRLENGKFGICVSCGKKIAEERINALPYAVMCINCQSRSEKRKR